MKEIVLDTETTGLDYSRGHKIIEIGCVEIIDRKITNNNSEDVLTRHLLKLSEIESQFQDLTNKFEEINFKLDKLSSRLTKVQSDNQLRFQQLESGALINNDTNKITKLNENKESEQILPGS